MSETTKMFIWMAIAFIDTLIIIHDTYYKDTCKGGNRGYDRRFVHRFKRQHKDSAHR